MQEEVYGMAEIKKPYAYSITPLYHSEDGGGLLLLV